MRILLVDDDPGAVATVRKALEKAGHDCEVVDFEARDAAQAARPADLVVLDLMGGGEAIEGEAGRSAYAQLWGTQFCPVIVYSAEPDLLDAPAHSLVKKVRKGRGSETLVLAAVQELEPYARAVSDIAGEVGEALREALRDTDWRVFVPEPDESGARLKAVRRVGRRRVFARLDAAEDGELPPETTFIVPPIGGDLLTGDILLTEGGKSDPADPISYRIILTPSCDLAGARPGGDRVLCSRCKILPSAARQRSETFTQGYSNGYFPIPRIPGHSPAMCADLKDLELLERSDILAGGCTRVASLDSPFREQLISAYSNTACRVGVPNRDLAAWKSQYTS